jgi:hypothetical protein
MPGQPAPVAAQFEVGAGWLEGLIALDAPHFDASPGWTPVMDPFSVKGFAASIVKKTHCGQPGSCVAK